MIQNRQVEYLCSMSPKGEFKALKIGIKKHRNNDKS
jgi:hypothetical protein